MVGGLLVATVIVGAITLAIMLTTRSVAAEVIAQSAHAEFFSDHNVIAITSDREDVMGAYDLVRSCIGSNEPMEFYSGAIAVPSAITHITVEHVDNDRYRLEVYFK